jgi:hypothetical protein
MRVSIVGDRGRRVPHEIGAFDGGALSEAAVFRK